MMDLKKYLGELEPYVSIGVEKYQKDCRQYFQLVEKYLQTK
jgi:hypothetical protein